MKKIIQIILLVGVLGLSASITSAAHIKLFVLTGQSNSLGTTNGGEADPTSGSDPADQHVQFFWHNVAGEGVTIGDSGGVFTTLQDQQGGVYAGSATHWGGEMEFARTLYRAGVRDFGVIKASRGGGGNTYWLKGSADDHMYEHVTNTVAAATADLTANGHTFEIVGLLYLQGESDRDAEITEAGTRLKTLTDNLRIDLPNASAMHTIAAGTTAAGLTSSANQAATAAVTAYMDTFPNTDLTLSPDGLHLNKAAKIILGNRWAQAFLNADIVDRHYGKLAFVGDSITQGGGGYSSYRYPIFKNLANAGVTNIAATGYEFVGSVTGAYQTNPGTTANVNGQTFANQHDGHYGWRAFWENARVALDANRYNVNNLGQGTIENWTGQTPTFDTSDAGTLTYTGTTYVPDTAVIMIGINDMAGSSSAIQARDDISLMVDQIQAANSNVNIFLSQTLHTDQNNATLDIKVDDLNNLLPALADSKTTVNSSVWVIETDTGFDPASQTHDSVHPNVSGEIYIGDRISGGLGIIEMPNAAGPAATPLTLEEKASDRLGGLHFEGADIYNTGSYASGWSATGDLDPTAADIDDLTISHPPGSGAAWLEGTSSGWSDLNDGVWTFEARLKFNANPEGIILWLGTGTDLILVEIYGDHTQDNGANSFNVAHNNLDGSYHTFTVKHDPNANVYYVWRDDVLLNPGGTPYDSTADEERLILGDYTSGTFGDGFDATIDYIDICRGYEGNEIYSGTGWINGFSSVGGVSPSIVDTTDLQIANTTAGGSWIEGTSSGWSAINEGYWTFETRIKFDANPNGFILWLGTDTDAAWVEIYVDRTQDSGGQTFSVAHNNLDGAFHTFRVGHDPSNSVYHVWRDGVRLTPLDGAGYDSEIDSAQMILGDYTTGIFGDNFDATIDYIHWDTGNVYLPPGADADGDGMSDLFEDTYFGGLTNGAAGGNNDGDDQNKGEATFRILSGNAVLWESGTMKTGDAAKPFDVELPAGCAKLYLQTDDLGNNAYDHANWVDLAWENGIRAATVDARTFLGKDFGLRPGSRDDQSAALRKALQALQKSPDSKLVLEKGTYHFWHADALKRHIHISNHDQPTWQPVCIPLVDLHGATIEGNGSLFLFHGDVQPILIQDSENVTLSGIAIDYEIPHHSQGIITDVDDSSYEMTVDQKQFPHRIVNGWFLFKGENWERPDGNHGIIFDGRTREIVAGTSDYDYKGELSTISDGRYRVQKNVKSSGIKVGDVITMRQGWRRPHPAVMLYRAKNTVLQDFSIHSSDGMGLLAQRSENILLKGGGVYPRKGTGRYFSSGADATHFSNCKGGIITHDCLYEGMMDDAINVHATCLRIEEKMDDRTLRLRYIHGQAIGFEVMLPGEALRFIHAKHLAVGEARTIASMRRLNTRDLLVTFDKPIPDGVGVGDAVESADWHASVEFRGNTVRNNRARGSLFTTPHPVVVEDNVFETIAGSAILLAGDANGWYESGACADVLIRNNLFKNNLTSRFQFTEAIISIFPEIPDVAGQEDCYHRNVRIEDNTFDTFDVPLVFAISTDGLSFTGNRVTYNDDYPAWKKTPFILRRCKDVEVTGNKVKNAPLEWNVNSAVRRELTEKSEVKFRP